MTKAIIFSGTHSRHLFVIKHILDIFNDVQVIVMQREDLLPKPPGELAKVDENNFIKHFTDRKEVEEKFFGNLTPEEVLFGINYKVILPEELNGEKICKIVKNFSADIAFIFGSDLIKFPLINFLPLNKINLHLGLSPWLKGSATLFWPFYLLLPQFAGITFHQITESPDAGEIIHQSCPKLFKTDGIHDVASRCVLNSAKEAQLLLKQFCVEKKFNGQKQLSVGKLWQTKDFHPSHLRIIYNLFDNDIVKHYLDGNLSNQKPKLFSCLKSV